MSDEQWLREGLADAVPDPPAAPDRARAAEHKARQRRRTTVLAAAGAAAAVAAVAVAVPLLGGADGGDESATDPTSDTPTAVVECPPEPKPGRDGVVPESELDRPDPDAPAAVPEGATSARLCQGPGMVIEVPDQALVTDVSALVTTINELDRTGEPQVCTMDLGPGYRIAFGYDDGSEFVVSGQLYGCRTLVVGSGYRADPQQAFDRFTELLAAQPDGSATSGPAEGEAPLDCNDGLAAEAGPFEAPWELTEAVLCPTARDARMETVTIPADDLEVLLADLRRNQSYSILRCGVTGPHPHLFGRTPEGDLVGLPSACGLGFWQLSNGKAWIPSREAFAILERLMPS